MQSPISEGSHEKSQTAPLFPTSHTVNELLKSYMASTHLLHPFLDDPRALVEQCVKQQPMSSIQNAISWLILALGEIASGKPQDSLAVPLYSQAASLLCTELGQHSVAHAQASILAALMSKSSCAISQPEVQVHRRGVTLIYWTCVLLEREILACFGTLPLSNLHIYRKDMLQTLSPLPEDSILGTYHCRIFLDCIRDDSYTVMKKYSRGEHIAIEYLHSWRNWVPSKIGWMDDDLPCANPVTALLRAEYYRSLHVVLHPPYLVETADVSSPLEKLERDKKLDEYALIIYVESTTRVIETFTNHLHNPVYAYYTLFKAILALEAFFKAALPIEPLLTVKRLTELLSRSDTILFKVKSLSPLLAELYRIFQKWKQEIDVGLLESSC
ncbi:hypothetical protein EK21DRAFT_117378 [Setomelanomma holmii]|uniref:Transcription factor domain-containing protein n=1 Tax=Setomelanomma holmii TaxID=210430 RepID=A0A9P4GY90_9PLEO|nr:hypothetical protein EK21DRAFT_117378 [Setomelanomma holmii]